MYVHGHFYMYCKRCDICVFMRTCLLTGKANGQERPENQNDEWNPQWNQGRASVWCCTVIAKDHCAESNKHQYEKYVSYLRGIYMLIKLFNFSPVKTLQSGSPYFLFSLGDQTICMGNSLQATNNGHKKTGIECAKGIFLPQCCHLLHLDLCSFPGM